MKTPVNDSALESELEELNLHESDDDSYCDDKAVFQEEPCALVYCVISGIAWLRYFFAYRRVECLLSIVLVVCVTLALTDFIFELEGYATGPQHKRPVLHDYSDIKSAMELKLGDIDHWCYDGGDDKCPMCEDPLEAAMPQEKGWRDAFMKNAHETRKAKKEYKKFDVIFLGDSITEARTGTIGGAEMEGLKTTKAVFDSQFSTENGGMYNGLALGVNGDTSPNLLWRITQNEVPMDLNPKIWWITIGMNDLTSTMCSEQVTVMGILRVVEELYATRPDSKIVINSILPKAVTRTGKTLRGKFIRNKYFDSIEQVNARLQTFANKHGNRVHFFDANAVFVKKARGKVFMRRELFTDKYHPNAEGHKIWGEAQIQFISKILPLQLEKGYVKSSALDDENMNRFDDDGDYYDYLNLYNEWGDDY